ncbi:hypothetical protein L1987_01246 [Smallanthus sonchifolius]|uniref:Uncharacterized protein n=1 Tax=Smallanthus sonchifolius TaxID=185202 RepID=A0ACB9K4E4_9ASTR|nr:hypothetical protein L1987_01246 [Smallanthus sonchifolius]
MSCFQGLFVSPESASLLLHNFCIYHINPPGHELGAASICINDPVPSIEDRSDQILARFNKVWERVTGLILISPLCKAPSWNEWLYNKFISKLLYYYGMCDLVKELLIHRYFSKEVCGNLELPESDMVLACRKLLNDRDSINVWRYLQAIDRRPDINEDLESLECKTIIFVGDSSPFHDDALHMTAKLGRNCSALVEVHACGSMVTQEHPHAMFTPLENFLKGFGLYRPCRYDNSPRSPLGPCCIDPVLLYHEKMGLKLRPIKIRASPPEPRAHEN